MCLYEAVMRFRLMATATAIISILFYSTAHATTVGHIESPNQSCNSNENNNLLIENVYDAIRSGKINTRKFFHLFRNTMLVYERQCNSEELRQTNVFQLNKLCLGDFHGAEVYNFSGSNGVGLRSTKDIRKGQLIISSEFEDQLAVYGSCWIVWAYSQHIIIGTNLTWQDDALLSLKLLVFEEMASSKWRPLIDHLRWSLHAHPLLFNEDELGILSESIVIESLQSELIHMIESYVTIYKRAAQSGYSLTAGPLAKLNLKQLTIKNFFWAWVTVMARAHADGHSVRLMPCWDFMNHGAKPNTDTELMYDTSPHDDRRPAQDGRVRRRINVGKVETRAASFIPRHTEIFGDYHKGIMPMDNMFVNFGIISLDAPFHLPFDMNTASKETFVKNSKFVYKQFGTEIDQITLVLFDNSTIYSDVTFQLALALQTGKKRSDLSHKKAVIAVVELVDEQVTKQLTRYSQPVEYIDNLLQSKVLSPNAHLAYRFLRAEIAILESIANRCKDKLIG